MVDATYGYNNVGKKSSEQDVVIIMAARAGSTPALSTKRSCSRVVRWSSAKAYTAVRFRSGPQIAPLAHLVRAADS